MATKKAVTAATTPSPAAVYAKAIAAFIVTALGAVGTWSAVALADNTISTQEWVALVVAVLSPVGAFFGVAITTNAEPGD